MVIPHAPDIDKSLHYEPLQYPQYPPAAGGLVGLTNPGVGWVGQLYEGMLNRCCIRYLHKHNSSFAIVKQFYHFNTNTYFALCQALNQVDDQQTYPGGTVVPSGDHRLIQLQ